MQRGVLTEEQIAAALAEQETSGERLGEVIVRLGFAAGPMIAQALATQHGRLLKTEYGFAVGFDNPAEGSFSPPPVDSLPAQAKQPATTTLAGGLRVTPRVEPEPKAAPTPAEVQTALAAPDTPTGDEVALEWQRQAQQLTAERDAALRDLRAAAVESAASTAELEAVTVRCCELEAAAAEVEAERAAVTAARDEAVGRNAELERQLEELQAASMRATELEAARAAGENELAAALARAREETARIQMEKAALHGAYEAIASRNASLEERLKELHAAHARMAELENGLAAVRALAEQERDHHPDPHADDPAHLLFVPGREGYRLVEQDGPPPIPGSTLELPKDDGTSSKLVVAKIGPSPLPSGRLACAYLVAAE